MGEPLIEHLAAGLDAMRALHRRIGRIAAVPDRFWTWASLAILLHDAGKVADGFQTMVGNGTRPPQPWGQRHEVYSLGFVARLLSELTDEERLWVATGVATHHRPFTAPPDGHRTPLFATYDHTNPEAFTAQFGPANPERITALMQWLDTAAHQAALLPARTGPVAAPTVEEFGAQTYELFEQLRQRWEWPLPPEQQPDGLTAVLLQGAVTLADHVCSAHGELHTTQPLDPHYAQRLEQRLAQNGHALRPHQHQAAITDGHLLLRAPTGSGKTEAALLWASTQIQTLRHATGATPRLFYTLPYLASINAMTTRLRAELDTEDVGVAHSRAGSYHLSRALAEECATDPTAPAGTDGPVVVDAAAKAVSRAAATRLFRELVRVATPYQLLRGAIAGPAHSSNLLDAANSVFVLDELHAYEPRRLGMILAMLRFWEDLGGRIAILSATLPDALADLLRDTLAAPMNMVEPIGEWPARHRIEVQPTYLTGPDSITTMVANLRAGRSVLVVANNVADARALYEQLAPVARKLHGPDAALLLHSRFRRADRARIEDNIRARFGTNRPPTPACSLPPRSSRSPSTSTSMYCTPPRPRSRRCCSASAGPTASRPAHRHPSWCTRPTTAPAVTAAPRYGQTAYMKNNPPNWPGTSSPSTTGTTSTNGPPATGSTRSTPATGASIGVTRSDTPTTTSASLSSASTSPTMTAANSSTSSTNSSTVRKPFSPTIYRVTPKHYRQPAAPPDDCWPRNS
jgi:CRISPR-associated endonuclease/helicase Cas3